jgi:hypothetical protein
MNNSRPISLNAGGAIMLAAALAASSMAAAQSATFTTLS